MAKAATATKPAPAKSKAVPPKRTRVKAAEEAVEETPVAVEEQEAPEGVETEADTEAQTEGGETEAEAAEGTDEAEAPATESVYHELLAAVHNEDKSFKPQHAKETKVSYLRRLTSAVSNISDDGFNSLSDAAAAWYDESAKKMNTGQPIDECPGFVAIQDQPKTAKNKGGDTKTKGAERVKKPGVLSCIRGEVIKNPDITPKELRAVVEQSFPDVKDATLSVGRTDTLAVVKLAREMGKWKD